jgi:hypothetical protein
MMLTTGLSRTARNAAEFESLMGNFESPKDCGVGWSPLIAL